MSAGNAFKLDDHIAAFGKFKIHTFAKLTGEKQNAERKLSQANLSTALRNSRYDVSETMKFEGTCHYKNL